MEAMTGASVAALTLYDMLKGAGKSKKRTVGQTRGEEVEEEREEGGHAIVIERVRLLEKSGGASGTFNALKS